MNVPITGRIYHVVDKTTGEVVKVGSTVRSLKVRWWNYNKKIYSNHFLRLAREIQSSEQDVYDPNDLRCPFLWHLVAAEQMEIFKMGTFRKSKLSNLHLPLFQKFNCFDKIESIKAGASLGGKISGVLSRDNKIGIHNPDFDHASAGRISGLMNVESGHLRKISSAGGKASGTIVGKRNAESGWMSKLGKSVPFEVRSERSKIVGPRAMHIRWHVNSGKSNPRCSLCSEQSLIIAFA